MDHPAENSTDRCGALKPNAKLTDMPCEVDICFYTISIKHLYQVIPMDRAQDTCIHGYIATQCGAICKKGPGE